MIAATVPKLKPYQRQRSINVSITANGCWECTERCTDKNGYPVIGFQNKLWKTAKLIWYLKTGDIPPYICHHCDNPKCVNPKHLFVGSHKDNMEDKARKHRSYRPIGEANGRATISEKVAVEILRGVPHPEVNYFTKWNILARKTWRHL